MTTMKHCWLPQWLLEAYLHEALSQVLLDPIPSSALGDDSLAEQPATGVQQLHNSSSI